MPNGYSATSYPNGVNNASVGTVTSQYVAPDPSLMHTFFDDFDSYIVGAAGAATWVATGTGGGTSALVAGGDGGQLIQNTTAANNDSNILQLRATSFIITPNQDCWIKTRFQLTNATNAAFVIGLIADATPFSAITNGFYIQKSAASTTLTAKVTKASATSTINIGTLANTTFVNAGMHYTGGTVAVYFNNSLVGSLPVTNVPTAALNVTMAVSNGTAAINAMTTDYILASTLRAASAM
jgi:hypothetical protein